MEIELQRAREELRTTREEMQTSQEELKSANEELQSINEGRTSSKEEMQSLNEELQTVNNELNAKVNELSRMNDDMKNLLNSTDVATLFLDNNLKVRRFTNPVAKLINLIPTDMGRRITDITSELVYPNLADDADQVLRSLVFIEKEIATRDGRWFMTKIMPYRTTDNMIDGVVITFVESTASKKTEAELRDDVNRLEQALSITQSALEHAGDAFFILNNSLELTYLNLAAEKMLNKTRPEVLGKSFFEAFPEAGKSIPAAFFHQAVTDHSSKNCAADFESIPDPGHYQVRVHPWADGILVSFQFSAGNRRNSGGEKGAKA